MIPDETKTAQLAAKLSRLSEEAGEAMAECIALGFDGKPVDQLQAAKHTLAVAVDNVDTALQRMRLAEERRQRKLAMLRDEALAKGEIGVGKDFEAET